MRRNKTSSELQRSGNKWRQNIWNALPVRFSNLFPVHCDFVSEAGYVWTLIKSFSLANNDQFEHYRFGVDHPVNEDGGMVNWDTYSLSLPRMQSIADVSTHLRATCNFPDYGLVYTDYARAKLVGHDLFGYCEAQCRTYEYLNIRGIECQEWQERGNQPRGILIAQRVPQ